MGGVGEKAINLFKIGARRGLDVTTGAVAPILKRLIAVNTFVSPWGLKILGWEILVCMEESESYNKCPIYFPLTPDRPPFKGGCYQTIRVASDYKSSIKL